MEDVYRWVGYIKTHVVNSLVTPTHPTATQEKNLIRPIFQGLLYIFQEVVTAFAIDRAVVENE